MFYVDSQFLATVQEVSQVFQWKLKILKDVSSVFPKGVFKEISRVFQEKFQVCLEKDWSVDGCVNGVF